MSIRIVQLEIARSGPRIELVPQMVPELRGMRLTSPMRAVDSRGRVLQVPAEFHTDFESVPALVRWIIGWVLGDMFTTALAGVLHDGLYATGELPKREADLIFWEMLSTLDPPRSFDGGMYLDLYGNVIDRSWTGPASNWLKWSAVRIGGWRAWNTHRSRDAKPDWNRASSG